MRNPHGKARELNPLSVKYAFMLRDSFEFRKVEIGIVSKLYIPGYGLISGLQNRP